VTDGSGLPEPGFPMPQHMAETRAHIVRRDRPIVAAQGLTKVFKDFWMRQRARAVDRVSFEIWPREVFGLLGPNGSGKSTTIKMVLGLLKPSAGRLAVFGRPPTDVAIKRHIGYLPEETYLYGFLDARETLDYYGKLFGLAYKERRRRIDELIGMVGLTAAQFRPVREYSKGMQRRIGLAQALINDPELLILDEPTSGLDPIGTRQVKDLIIELGRRGKTVLLSSHLLADVEDCVDRMVILYGGKIRQEGPADELLTERSRTTIETEALDDETIAEIDELLRRRSGGARSILTVSHPRQKLESKFLEIVEQARAERVETSGVAETGEMAEFLRGDARGDSLIQHLVEAGDEDAMPPPEVESASRDAERQTEIGARAEVISELLGQGAGQDDDRDRDTEPDDVHPDNSRAHDEQHTEPRDRERPASDRADQTRPEIDQSVIGSLLDAGPDEEGDPDGRDGSERA